MRRMGEDSLFVEVKRGTFEKEFIGKHVSYASSTRLESEVGQCSFEGESA